MDYILLTFRLIAQLGIVLVCLYSVIKTFYVSGDYLEYQDFGAFAMTVALLAVVTDVIIAAFLGVKATQLLWGL